MRLKMRPPFRKVYGVCEDQKGWVIKMNETVIFSWNEELTTGIELIDNQHKQLLKLANSFFIQHKCGQHDHAEDSLRFLLQYIQYHFQAEEAYQVECSYAKYRAHQAIHDALAVEVKIYAVRLRSSHFSDEELDRFYTFFTSWIKDHVFCEDLDFARQYHLYLTQRVQDTE